MANRQLHRLRRRILQNWWCWWWSNSFFYFIFFFERAIRMRSTLSYMYTKIEIEKVHKKHVKKHTHEKSRTFWVSRAQLKKSKFKFLAQFFVVFWWHDTDRTTHNMKMDGRRKEKRMRSIYDLRSDESSNQVSDRDRGIIGNPIANNIS